MVNEKEPITINVQNAEQAVEQFFFLIKNQVANLILVDGFPSSGKTAFSKVLEQNVHAIHIEIDNYFLATLTNCHPRIPKSEKPSYVDYVDKPKVCQEIEQNLAEGKIVIIDGSCLNELFPNEIYKNRFRIYCSQHQVSYDEDWVRPPINSLVDFRHNPNRSVFLYHQKFLPHRIADVIIVNNPN